MFAILDAKEKFSNLVYNALVFILGILVDERTSAYTNFRRVLDGYIEKQFAGKSAHKTLLNWLQQNMTKLEGGIIRDTMKALEYLFKFIVASIRNNLSNAPMLAEVR